MPDRDYSHRDVVDKLGVRLDHSVAFVEAGGDIDPALREKVAHRTQRGPAGAGERVDILIAATDDGTDVVSLLREWSTRLQPSGGIWLLTPKRGKPGYVKQDDLIPAGIEAGLVDNKICSVSDTQSAMRFVIRRRDRTVR